ncbi:putative NHL repeat containing protein [Candidatus Sulfopaludibacter sp. SbA3]|nr:putative NHL repeat containing protein [Candidatus Sulfopaludibacter sp. SbA3]
MALLTAVATCTQAQSIITTVAGKGRILTGVGGPATGVPLGGPIGLAFDSKQNLYIADNQQNVVFKMQPNGTMTVFAGSGVRGFSGDGGPATAAALMEPKAVAVDAADNVYIADFHNERIRKVDQKGIITTFAGGGAAYNTDEIPATAGTVFEPGGMAFDSAGALYFCEDSDIRKITPDGIIHHVAGNGFGFAGDGGPAATAKFAYPQNIAFDSKGNLYIADQSNNRIRKIDTKGNITTVAGGGPSGNPGDGGPATSASLIFPAGVVVDSAGNLYIAESEGNRVRKVSSTGIITTVAGTGMEKFSGDGGPASSATLNLPVALVLDPSGNLYIADQNNRRIRRVDSSGSITTIAGSGVTNFAGDGGQATLAAMDFPTDVKVDGAGNLYVADAMNHRVRKITPAGVITTIAGTGTAGFSGDGGPATSAQLNVPASVAIDPIGNLYISDQQNLRIRMVTPDGIIRTYAGNGLYDNSAGGYPATGVSVGIPNLYIVDPNHSRVRKVTPAGVVSTAAGNGNAGFSGDGGPASAATLNNPFGVAVDGAGNLFITDAGNRAVRKVSTDGTISTIVSSSPAGQNPDGVIATSGKVFLDGADGIAADDQGNVYLDATWHIFRINPSGILTLLTGGGLQGYQEGFDGDGGPSVAAHMVHDTTTIFSPVMGMTVDGSGNLFVADTGNDRIRKITNPNAAAQLAITTPDSFNLYPPTGADKPDLFLFGNTPQRLTISNVGTGPMPWTASVSTLDGGNWLQISSNSGNAPSTITLSANTTNLAPGLYWATMLLSAPVASNSPRYVLIGLTVPLPFLNGGASSGTFVVSEPAGVGWVASSNVDWFTIHSPAGGSGSGSFTYSVAANSGATLRSTTLTVAGNSTILVNQGGQGPLVQAIVDAFDYTPGVAPGAWVTITGSNLMTGSPQTWNLSGTQQLPTKLGGTIVVLNGAPAALYYVSPTQINALVPAAVAPGLVQVVVQANGVNSSPFPITATATLPSIYAIPNSDGSAFFVTAALAGTGTLIGNSAVDPRVTRAALPGDVLDLYMAGLGATTDASQFITTQVFAGAYPVSAAVTASVAGESAQVLFAGLTSPGLYLVRVVIPSDLAPGPQPIQITAGGLKTRPSLMLMVGAP